MRAMKLVGGPYDGAEGPDPGAHPPSWWVEPGQARDGRVGRNGLLLHRKPPGVRYDLQYEDEGVVVYAFRPLGSGVEQSAEQLALA